MVAGPSVGSFVVLLPCSDIVILKIGGKGQEEKSESIRVLIYY